MTPGQLFFGRVVFQDTEEYLEFRFKFLCLVLLSGALFTVVLLLGILSGVSSLAGFHVASMCAFATLALVLWLILRGHKGRLYPVAWVYETCCLLQYSSALAFVPSDEMRAIWFATNIPGVYIILGQRAGLCISLLTLAGLAFGNRYLGAPYSRGGLATMLVGFAYLTVFFHVFGNRSISYFRRMREANRQLHFMANHDPLSGAMNARAYYLACDQLILLARRNLAPYAVLFVDLDHFKQINDTHGHAAGDVVLKAVAQCLIGGVRQSDVVGRIGGEEFSVFLPNTDLAGALKLAETLRQAVENLISMAAGQYIRVTASIGVTVSPQGEQSLREAQRLADQAMYAAKSQGRNRVATVEAAAL